MQAETRHPKIIEAKRPGHRGQTLAEVLVAIAILSVIVVFVSTDLTNLMRVDTATDRSIEAGAANFLLGVMKSDQNFWQPDWTTGPSNACLQPLGPFTDQGPSPSPNWHAMPTSAPGCPEIPFNDPGGPQTFPSGGGHPAPVGDAVQYMWNASEHGSDPWAADLTVWVRRDAGAPTFEYHAIRYEYPGANQPSPIPSGSPTVPPPPTPPPPTPTPRPTPSLPPTPQPSPTPIGV